MCGVCGVFHFGTGEAVAGEAVEAMKGRLVHRGPDEDGTHVDGPVGLGHRRLSIIGVSDGRQPLCNEDGSVWVTFNGEIYNHRELRRGLEAKGHTFRTRTDTEALVHLYEEDGVDLLPRLRGMFAFAIWDRRARRLLVARDRVGKKPLFYTWDGGRFAFASEIKALLTLPWVQRRPDPEGLHHFLGLGYVPAPWTAFAGIHCLPAASWMVVDPDGPGPVRRYWEPMFAEDPEPDEDGLLERLAAGLDEAVAVRMESEVPLGVFLSGGVDSSAVAERVRAHAGTPVISSTIRFDHPAFDESPVARRVAGILGTDHREHRVEPAPQGLIERIVWHHDQPFADESALPTYLLCRETRRVVTVALSGDGGDELFAGYPWYGQLLEALRRRQRAPRWLLGALPLVLAAYPLNARGRARLLALAQGPAEVFATLGLRFRDEEKRRLYGEALRPMLGAGGTTEGLIARLFERGPEAPVSAAQYADLHAYLTDDILVKVDRMSMAHGLEVRAPLLDHELIEWAARVPWGWKLRDGESKYLLKRLLSRSLPADIVYRRKQGFSVPINDWLKGDMQGFVRDVLFDGRLAGRGYFDMKRLAGLWRIQQRHLRWHTDLSQRLWAIVVLELWHRLYVDGDGSAPGGAA
jgi:asparagine synthase (glutamine-hydrolysing)